MGSFEDANKIKSTAVTEIDQTNDLSALESVKNKYLGKKSQLSALSKSFSSLDPDQKRVLGKEINESLQVINEAYERRLNELKKTIPVNAENTDTTLPGIKPKLGFLHPTSILLKEINSFFRYYGYSVYEGPEIETNEYNFEKLNLPKDHPARGLADTLFIKEPEVMLRTHTSSVETRAMTTEELPLRIVVPGKVYRNENLNATNNSMFYQYEGLVVDENLSMAELKGMINTFIKFLYGENVKTRFRCKYYPQVEPGAGLDVQCSFCKGEGCVVCKFRGWVEVLGCGMVHPNVFRNCNIDYNKWSGFAFGLGLDRLVMLKFGVKDIRKLYSGELVFQG